MNTTNYRVIVATIPINTATDSKLEVIQGAGRNLVKDNVIPGQIVGLSVKTGWDTANIVLGAYNDINSSYDKVCDPTTGEELEFPVAEGRFIPIDPLLTKGLKRIKIYSRTSGSDVVQTSATEVLIHIIN